MENIKKGLFVDFEGVDGCGKTSVIREIKEYFDVTKPGMCINTREPGGTTISEKIREILLDPANYNMKPETEALLYAASRAQHTLEKIIPAVDNGKIVLSDRYLASSLAYQGYARGLGTTEVMEMNDFGIQGYRPDITIFLDITPKQAMSRMSDREFDRMEQEGLDFQNKLYEYYKRYSKHPKVKVVDATQPLEKVVCECLNIIKEEL